MATGVAARPRGGAPRPVGRTGCPPGRPGPGRGALAVAGGPAGWGPRSVRRRLDGILSEAMARASAHAGTVYLPVPGVPVLGLEVAAGFPPQFAAPWSRVGLSADTITSEAARTRKPVWVGSQAEMARRFPVVAAASPYPYAVASAPAVSDGTTRGVISLIWPGSHPPELSHDESDGLLTACDRLRDLLEGAAARGHPLAPAPYPRALRPPAPGPEPRQAARANAYVDRLPEGGCSLDLQGRITYVSPAAAEYLGRDASRLLGALPWKALPWLDEPTAESRYRAAVISRQPVSFTAVRPPDRRLSFQLYPADDGISVRITPVRDPRESAGPPEGAAAPPGTTRMDAVQQLLHLSGALTVAATVNDVTERMVEQLLPALGAKALALLVPDSGRLRIVGHHGFPPDLLDRFDGTPPASDSPGAAAVRTGQALFFASPAELTRAYPGRADRSDSMGAWVFLPLIASGRTVGCCVLAYERPHRFDQAEHDLLISLSGLLAQALDRARVYDAARSLARGLQAGLLPPAMPRLRGLEAAARYLPSTHGMDVGGDFYDLIRLGGTTAAAVIGDVEGHSVAAAALMGQVRTAIHAHAGAAPHTVLARTNRLLDDLDAGLFASCLYARLDPVAHQAHLANAGHLPALLRHTDGRTEKLDVPPGPLLGIRADAEYATSVVALPPGSILALYTDGLVEAPGTDLDDAVGRLAGILGEVGDQRLEAVADRLIHQAEDASDRTDDVAVLLVRAGGPEA